MTPYAITLTWAVGFVMGIIAVCVAWYYMDSNDRKEVEATLRQKHADEKDMNDAVALVKEAIPGSTVLSREHH